MFIKFRTGDVGDFVSVVFLLYKSSLKAEVLSASGARLEPTEAERRPGVKRRFVSTKCGEIRGIMGAKYLLTPASLNKENAGIKRP